MSETEKPAWLEGWQPAPPRVAKAGNPAWTPGMRSPNPRGRPPGITDKKAKLAQRMLADADGIVSVLIAQALDGDTGAASLVLSRVLPALRNQTEKVAFPFNASAPLAQQAEQVLDAVAAGAVAPDVGQLILQSIKALADVRGYEELESRIITLEAKQA
ncbi:DUF5681 domain-containing protein [Sphingomonas bacterium]|uniref:DUF5681 domain-containing protein n=1 Tax=Sphingomonas bacterium TaxID=1895847 RepID=UPI00262ABE1F|nr:DUF5681 domain-containing protein [Sphingomonas bacterium]MDB5678391.1 hypothetical protein [Sphingomonas bacterium]